MRYEGTSQKIILLDGAMGTVLQQKGLPPGGQPELLNLTEPELICSVHREYVEAGSQVVYTNTFGANGLKLAKTGHSVEEGGLRRCAAGQGGRGRPGPGGAGYRAAGAAAGTHGQPAV